MNLSEIRQAIFDLANWSPNQSTEAKARADRFINQSLQQLSYKHPRLFEREVSLWTQPDVVSDAGDTTDRLNAVLDGTYAWVLELQKDPALVLWPTDGSWDGRQIEFQDSAGVWHSNVIREVHEPIKGAKFRVSLVRPIADVTGTPYTIWTPQLVLPSDVVKISRPRMVNSLGEQPLIFEDRGTVGVRDLSQLFELQSGLQTTGTPGTVYPGLQLHLPGPEKAPSVTASVTAWGGPSPAGLFGYKLTYRWGRRDGDTRSNRAFRDPLYESAPSPEARYTAVHGAGAPLLTLPVPDWMLDFYNALGGGPAYNRDTRSGLRIGVWRKRYSSATGSAVGANAEIDTFGWCLIAEVEGHMPNWTDTGSILEDRTRRLKSTQGYESLVLYPRPTERSELRVDALIRPQPLEHDNDTPVLPVEGMHLLIYRAAHLLYQSMNEKTWAQNALALAAEAEAEVVKHRGRLSNTRRQRRLTRGGLYRVQ